MDFRWIFADVRWIPVGLLGGFQLGGSVPQTPPISRPPASPIYRCSYIKSYFGEAGGRLIGGVWGGGAPPGKKSVKVEVRDS